MYSFSFQSTARMKWPSSLRRLERWEAMKPPAPVTQIFIFLWPSVNFFSATEGRTCGEARQSWHALAGHPVLVPACPVQVCVCGPHTGPHASCYVSRVGAY